MKMLRSRRKERGMTMKELGKKVGAWRSPVSAQRKKPLSLGQRLTMNI